MKEMDEIDSAQQKDIESIQEKNKEQDFWLKFLGIAIIAWIMIVTTVMMVRMTQWNSDGVFDNLEKRITQLETNK